MKTLIDDIKSKNKDQEDYSEININNLLNENKKIVAFIGASKSGTSFMINNVAQDLSTKGVNVAILDVTQNRSSYYIYTKNEENLRRIASTSTELLVEGQARGIEVNNNLSVYTALPGENEQIQKVEPILETLLKKHSLVLIDCDFKTPIKYFEYAMEIYLVQTMEILTIQPLTEFLSNLKNKGVLQDTKLRIIINKYVKVDGITEREIIGGMSYYNDPAMAYMKELFNRNLVPYMTIPFDVTLYEKYLMAVVNCDINLEGYSYNFIHLLEQLSKEVYSFENNL
mgnify:CR=1 FL=1